MAKLLIVDDKESLCQVLKDSFGKGGHEVDVATSGQDAKDRKPMISSLRIFTCQRPIIAWCISADRDCERTSCVNYQV